MQRIASRDVDMNHGAAAYARLTSNEPASAGSWKGWQDEGIMDAKSLCVGNLADGRLLMLLRTRQGNLLRAMECEDGTISSFEDCPEELPPGISLEGPAALALHARDGRMVAACQGSDRQVWEHWFEPASACSIFRWKPSGGVGIHGVAIVERQTGGLEAFLVDPAARLWHRWTTREFLWSDWAPLDGMLADGVAVCNNAAGFPEVFARDADNVMWVRRHRHNGEWTPWSSLGGRFQGRPFAMQDPGGRINVWAMGFDGQIYVCRQSENADIYWDWQPQGGCQADNVYVVYDSAGCMRAFSRGFDGQVWCLKSVGNGYSRWTKVGGQADTLVLGKARKNGSRIFALSQGKLYTRLIITV